MQILVEKRILSSDKIRLASETINEVAYIGYALQYLYFVTPKRSRVYLIVRTVARPNSKHCGRRSLCFGDNDCSTFQHTTDICPQPYPRFIAGQDSADGFRTLSLGTGSGCKQCTPLLLSNVELIFCVERYLYFFLG